MTEEREKKEEEEVVPVEGPQTATGGIGEKQQSLIQKCKIFLELLKDTAVHGGKAILADDVESNIATLSADPPDDANVITKTLMIKLKECMVQLGDLINLQNQSQIRALGDYLDAAKEVIESLNGKNFDEEKKALDDAQCDLTTMTEADCQAKLNAAIKRVNALKTEMQTSIEEKKGGLSAFEGRKENIEELKAFFKVDFNDSLNEEKIEELTATAKAMQGKMVDSEKTILTEFISGLDDLKQKLGEVGTKKEELSGLQEQTAKLNEELSQIAAQKAQTDAEIATQEAAMAQNVDGDPEKVEEGTQPVEEGAVAPVVEEGGEETTDAQVEEGTGTEGQGGEETTGEEINSDEGSNEEVAGALAGQKLEEQRMQSDSSDFSSGDTASENDPPNIINPPAPGGKESDLQMVGTNVPPLPPSKEDAPKTDKPVEDEGVKKKFKYGKIPNHSDVWDKLINWKTISEDDVEKTKEVFKKLIGGMEAWPNISMSVEEREPTSPPSVPHDSIERLLVVSNEKRPGAESPDSVHLYVYKNGEFEHYNTFKERKKITDEGNINFTYEFVPNRAVLTRDESDPIYKKHRAEEIEKSLKKKPVESATVGKKKIDGTTSLALTGVKEDIASKKEDAMKRKKKKKKEFQSPGDALKRGKSEEIEGGKKRRRKSRKSQKGGKKKSKKRRSKKNKK